jgi:SAM-dependent methyltransferase
MPVEKLALPEQSVDVIASFETIEHLFSPREFILSCKRYLRPGGLLVLSAPNFYGFDNLSLREYSNSVDHEHLNYFNPDSLPKLLKQCGFEVVDVQTPGELDAEIVRNKLINGVVDFSNQYFLRHILTERWDDVANAFQEFLSDNLLSGHMWVTARV